MIGERINPTGRKMLAAEMAAGDYSRVVADALAQVEAGAQMLDVNAGIPLADEPRILAECIKLVQETVDVPLSIDSSIVAALEAGLAVYKGKPLVNSVTGEEERLERVLPLVKKYDARGDRDLQRRDRHLRGPRRALRGRQEDRRAGDGLRHHARGRRRRSAGHAGRRDQRRRRASSCTAAPPARASCKVNTSCGASNFSFGLPNRRGLNAAFLPMMIGAGLTSAIMNPLHAEDIQAILGADVVMGHDPNCGAWIRKYREPAPEGEAGAGGAARGAPARARV